MIKEKNLTVNTKAVTTTKRLINQGVFYTLSILLFQSFMTFYIIKYFNGLHGAILGNIILYLAMAGGYITVARINHNRSLSVKSWLLVSIIICLLSTCMMQRQTLWILFLGFALLGFGKGIYFCCLGLYEFDNVIPEERTRYAATQNAWKSALEIIIPFVLGYMFSVIPGIASGYLVIFLLSACALVLTAMSIYQLPDFFLKPLHHSHYKTIIKKTSRVSICYMMLVGLYVIVPFIGTLLEVQILQQESGVGYFQGVTKLVTFVLLLLILHYSHVKHTIRYFMTLSFIMGSLLIFMSRWSGLVVLILYVVAKSLVFSLLITYEKPISMRVMESLSSSTHTMLPVILIQKILDTSMRVAVLLIAFVILSLYSSNTVVYSIIVITGIGFIATGLLAFYYLYQRAHNRKV